MKTSRMDAEAIPLLVSYGIGCVKDLVSEGRIAQECAKDLVDRVFANEPLSEADARNFKIAYAKCASLAKKMGKPLIDAEVIRTYFFDPSQHNLLVDAIYAAKKDFDPVDCKAQVGTIVELSERSALVATQFGGEDRRKTYRNHIRGLRVGDDVVVHSGHIAEGMSKELRQLIDRLKNADAKQKELLLGVFKSKERKTRVKS